MSLATLTPTSIVPSPSALSSSPSPSPSSSLVDAARTTEFHAKRIHPAAPTNTNREMPLGTCIALKRDRTMTFATIGFEDGLMSPNGMPVAMPTPKQININKQNTHQEKEQDKHTPLSDEPISKRVKSSDVPSSLYSLAGELVFGALPLCVLSINCNILDCNAAFVQQFGYARNDMMKMNLFELAHKSEIKEVFAMMEKLLEVAARLTAAYDLRIKGGTCTKETHSPPTVSNGLHTYERTCVLSGGSSVKLNWTVWATRGLANSKVQIPPTFMCAITPATTHNTTPASNNTATAPVDSSSPVTPSAPSTAPLSLPTATPTANASGSAHTTSSAFVKPQTPTAHRPATTTTALSSTSNAATTAATVPQPSVTSPPSALSALSVLSEVALPTIKSHTETQQPQQLQQQQQHHQQQQHMQFQQQAAVHAQVQHAQAQAAAQHQAAAYGHMMSGHSYPVSAPGFYSSGPYLTPAPSMVPVGGVPLWSQPTSMAPLTSQHPHQPQRIGYQIMPQPQTMFVYAPNQPTTMMASQPATATNTGFASITPIIQKMTTPNPTTTTKS